MYNARTRQRILDDLESGATLSQLSRRHGVSRSTIRGWRDTPLPVRPVDCPRCDPELRLDEAAYAELLGFYLGDGCISELAKGVQSLRVSCDAKYLRVIEEVEHCMRRVRPGSRTFRVAAPGCTVVQMHWKHWVCHFPQHGPGRKHQRHIALAPWQNKIVSRYPGPLLRGLFHSDGCRLTNWTVRTLRAGPKRYEYPRYLFSNESDDIIGICTAALDAVEVRWTRSRRNHVSVARRDSVALLDEFVGPKS